MAKKDAKRYAKKSTKANPKQNTKTTNRNSNPKPSKDTVYNIVTERIVSQLDAGVIPWLMPWDNLSRSWVTKKPYSILNQLLLERPGEYLTYFQVEKQGGRIKKGTEGGFVTFYKMIPFKHEDEDGAEVTKTVPMLRYYFIYHIDDIEGVELHKSNDETKFKDAEEIVKQYLERENGSLSLSHRYKEAAFRPETDTLCMPSKSVFDSDEHYYATLFHEMIHSTGKAYRCNRPLDTKFGADEYSKEELIAEIGSAFLCEMCGIDASTVIENQAAYIQNWASAIQADPRMIVQAAGKAQHAVEYILNGKGVKDQDGNLVLETKPRTGKGKGGRKENLKQYQKSA